MLKKIRLKLIKISLENQKSEELILKPKLKDKKLSQQKLNQPETTKTLLQLINHKLKKTLKPNKNKKKLMPRKKLKKLKLKKNSMMKKPHLSLLSDKLLVLMSMLEERDVSNVMLKKSAKSVLSQPTE